MSFDSIIRKLLGEPEIGDCGFVNIRKLVSELRLNPYRANEQYMNKYVTFKGYVTEISISGESIVVSDTRGNTDNLVCLCKIFKEDKSFVKALNIGDSVQVRGFISHIHPTIGYCMHTHSIEKCEYVNETEL